MKTQHRNQALALALFLCLLLIFFPSSQTAPKMQMQKNLQFMQPASNSDELPDEIVQSIAISNDAPAPK